MKYFCPCVKVNRIHGDQNKRNRKRFLFLRIQESKSSTEFFAQPKNSTDDLINSAIDDEQRAPNNRQISFDTTNDETRNSTQINKSPSLTSLMTNISAAPSPAAQIVYWLEIHLDRGKDLAIKDLNGTSDPYVKIFYGSNEKYTSSIIQKNLNPVWNEKISFFVHDLSIPIIFQLFDYDRIGRDEPMGTGKLELFKLPLEKTYSATLDLENEKRTDGKTGMIKFSITIMPKSAEFRDEVRQKTKTQRFSTCFSRSKVLRLMNKQLNTKPSLGNRSASNPGTIFSRRTIDIFIIEGRNLRCPSFSRNPNPFVRLKFGAHKKYRTQVGEESSSRKRSVSFSFVASHFQTAKSTTNPKWHQSFMYDVFVSELPPLELTVIDDTGGSGDFLAR